MDKKFIKFPLVRSVLPDNGLQQGREQGRERGKVGEARKHSEISMRIPNTR